MNSAIILIGSTPSAPTIPRFSTVPLIAFTASRSRTEIIGPLRKFTDTYCLRRGSDVRGKTLNLTSTSWEAEATILGIGTRNGKMTIISGSTFLAILQGEVPQTTHRRSRLTAEKKDHHCRYGPPVRNICELIRGAQCGDFLQTHVYTPCG